MPVENLLTIASGGTGLSYDPELRLYEVAGGGAATRFAYDGLNAIAEYDASNALQRRYVFDDRGNPVIWYEGADLSQRRFLAEGELGSVITVADSAANAIAIDTYDEYGIPSATNIGRFQYTGQMWIGEAGAYYYKNRMYSPGPGRFNQTDPMGYGGDGPNLYAYVLNDPVNRIDPTGLTPSANGLAQSIIINCIGWDFCPNTFVITGNRFPGIEDYVGFITWDLPRNFLAERRSNEAEQRQDQPKCPTGTLAATRHRALETAKWSGIASGVTAVAGAIPTPATPLLEGTAAGLKVAAWLSTSVALGADFIFFAQSGNSQPLANDAFGAAFGELPLGSFGTKANQLTSTGRAINRSTTGKIGERAGNAAQTANAATTWPDVCR